MHYPALTPALIGEALINTLVYAQPAEGWQCVVGFKHKGGGRVEVTLFDEEDSTDVDARTFQILEVHP